MDWRGSWTLTGFSELLNSRIKWFARSMVQVQKLPTDDGLADQTWMVSRTSNGPEQFDVRISRTRTRSRSLTRARTRRTLVALSRSEHRWFELQTISVDKTDMDMDSNSLVSQLSLLLVARALNTRA